MTKVLIVEDHPMLSDVYEKCILKTIRNAQIRIVKNLKQAEYEVERNEFDIAICDIHMGKVRGTHFLSGIDVAKELKRKNSKLKLIIATSINDLYRVIQINEELRPNVFLIKNDYRSKDLIEALKTMLKGERFYSATFQKLISKRDQFTNEYPLELKHFHLLLCLKQGYTNIQLERTFNVSNKTVLNWKNRISDAFGVDIKEIVPAASLNDFI